jgi:hypothetical protein
LASAWPRSLTAASVTGNLTSAKEPHRVKSQAEGRYRFPAAQLMGHHGVWGAFAFWSLEPDAVITETVNTARVDRRPLLGAVVRALTD